MTAITLRSVKGTPLTNTELDDNFTAIQEGNHASFTAGGTGNAITGTTTPSFAAYTTRQKLLFIATASNTGATTVDINGIGIKAITKAGASALVSGDIVSGRVYQIIYDGTQFQLLFVPVNLNQLTNGPGYITGINSGNVTTALGFTPYANTNPSGYITSSGSCNSATYSTSPYVTNDSGGNTTRYFAMTDGYTTAYSNIRAASGNYIRGDGYAVLAGALGIGLWNGGTGLSTTGDVTAYASDKRLKENIRPLKNALSRICSITGVVFDWTDESFKLGLKSEVKTDVGVFAQDVQAVLPEAIRLAPFDTVYEDIGSKAISKSGKDYLTVRYEKLVPLLIEAIKELNEKLERLENDT